MQSWELAWGEVTKVAKWREVCATKEQTRPLSDSGR